VLPSDEIVALSSTSSIVEVKDLTVLPSGTVWALNSAEPLFIEFAPDGRVVREYGRLGGGPNEFGSPSAFVAGNVDGATWVFDPERHALLEVSGHDGDRHETRLPTDSSLPPTQLFGGREVIGAGVRTARMGDEFVFGLNAPGIEGGTSWLRRYDAQRGDLRGGLVWLRLPAEGGPQEVSFPSTRPP
jgi:hypothetical protein